MVRRGEPWPKEWRRKDARPAQLRHGYERDEEIRLMCDDCNPTGKIISIRELVEMHALPLDMTYWALVQRLYCGDCGGRNIDLHSVAPNGYDREAREKRMAERDARMAAARQQSDRPRKKSGHKQ